jgi:hypothetical protein
MPCSGLSDIIFATPILTPLANEPTYAWLVRRERTPLRLMDTNAIDALIGPVVPQVEWIKMGRCEAPDISLGPISHMFA